MVAKTSILDSFKGFAQSTNGFPGHVIAFDPGERTGWAWMHGYELIESGEIQTGDSVLAYRNIGKRISTIISDIGYHHSNTHPLEDQIHIAAEDYRVYSWKSDDHKWAQIHTIKVVGMVELAAGLLNIPLRMRMAQHAKNFVTDDRLKQWGLWQKGERHARDAIRHACLYIVSYGQNKKAS